MYSDCYLGIYLLRCLVRTKKGLTFRIYIQPNIIITTTAITTTITTTTTTTWSTRISLKSSNLLWQAVDIDKSKVEQELFSFAFKWLILADKQDLDGILNNVQTLNHVTVITPPPRKQANIINVNNLMVSFSVNKYIVTCLISSLTKCLPFASI